MFSSEDKGVINAAEFWEPIYPFVFDWLYDSEMKWSGWLSHPGWETDRVYILSSYSFGSKFRNTSPPKKGCACFVKWEVTFKLNVCSITVTHF